MRGRDAEDVQRKLAPVVAEVRRRLGNFILAEDDETLEGNVLAALARHDGSLAVVETFTGGLVASRLLHSAGGSARFRRGVVARDLAEIRAAVGMGEAAGGGFSVEEAAEIACAACQSARATHGLAVLIEADEGAERVDFGGTVHLAIASAGGGATRHARIIGGRDWLRLGAVEIKSPTVAPLPPGPPRLRAHGFREEH